MFDTPEFKKAQKKINREQKKAWLSTNQKLNSVLRAINNDNSLRENFQEIFKRVHETKTFLSEKELVQIIEKLKSDKYLEEEIQGGQSSFYISIEGKAFIEDNGYVKQANQRTRNNIWKVVKIIGVIINGVILLALALLTYYNESKVGQLETTILKKDSIIHHIEQKQQIKKD